MPKNNAKKNSTRREHDLLGERTLPNSVYYGVQTLRAIENFHITDTRVEHFPTLIIALAQIKKAAALTNSSLKILDKKIADAISKACDELIDGQYHDQFPIDMIQGGAGTSTNMNANEVIANRALEIAGYQKGDYHHIHPNNHVNLGQSTNDVYPSAIHLSLLHVLPILKKSIQALAQAFHQKAEEFSDVIKMGRTQLQDAIPMTLGQEFEAFACTLTREISSIEHVEEMLLELNLGGTAIGTGLNAHPKYPEKVIQQLKKITGLNVNLSTNLIEATQDTTALVSVSSALKKLAVKLSKISNDLRLLSSGPRCGFFDIQLPAVQPGSSIMPGKVNPVIPEAVNQVAFQVIGSDTTITMASEAGQLQLNVFEPIIILNLLKNIKYLTRAMHMLEEFCVKNIKANRDVCMKHFENSIGLVTALNPIIGYEKSTMIAKEAFETGKSVFDIVVEQKLFTKEELQNIFMSKKILGK